MARGNRKVVLRKEDKISIADERAKWLDKKDKAVVESAVEKVATQKMLVASDDIEDLRKVSFNFLYVLHNSWVNFDTGHTELFLQQHQACPREGQAGQGCGWS